MTSAKQLRSILPLLAGVLVASAVAAVALMIAARTRPHLPPGNVRNLIAAYLADEQAAKEEYTDALVTASGIVSWSARSDEVTTRMLGEWSPFLVERSKQATVLLLVDDRHQVLADFNANKQREALALRPGERATIRGQHYSPTSVVYDGNVIAVLHGCEAQVSSTDFES
jgi:hypothetical protein